MKIVVFDRRLTGASRLFLCALSIIKKKKQSVPVLPHSCICRRLNHKWHLYLRASAPVRNGKHLRPCWPCSLSAEAISIITVSLSLSLSLLTSASTSPLFFFFHRLFSLSLSQFKLYHHFQVTRLMRWTEVEESAGDTGPSMWLHVLTKTRIYTY